MSTFRAVVIVPAHDEAESLPETLAELARVAPGADVLVLDDGSIDGTANVARAVGIPVVRHPVNLGVGAALQTGFRYALERGYDAAVQFDADGQHDPGFLEAVLAPVREGRCDVCIGSRYVAATGYRAPPGRRLGMLLFSSVTGLALGRAIADTTSGFRAYDAQAMRLCLRDMPADFPDAPLLIRLARHGLRLAEVPVIMRERRAGRSFYTLGKSLYYPFKTLLASLVAGLERSD